jgi:hypothetical protein
MAGLELMPVFAAIHEQDRGLMAVLVLRCDEGEPAVPSRVVQCCVCGADCWLGIATGDSTLALGAFLGAPDITCRPCIEAEIERQGLT